MPKKAFLAPHLDSKALKHKYMTSQDPVETRRWYILWKVSLGWTIKDSAIAVGLTYEYAKTIVNRYNERGVAGIKNGRKIAQSHQRGRKPLLNQQQLQKLTKAVEQRPEDGGIWSGPKVARWIEKETQLPKVRN